jgi:hypothetical protein
MKYLQESVEFRDSRPNIGYMYCNAGRRCSCARTFIFIDGFVCNSVLGDHVTRFVEFCAYWC